MQVIEAPQPFKHIKGKSLFLAGSIEMDKAKQWQKQVIQDLQDLPLTILNPRRQAWDISWAHDDPRFVEQVTWELDALAIASGILYYFDPETMAPITLMELGLHAKSMWKSLWVCCPTGYWRKGNVDILCKRYGIPQFSCLSSMTEAVRRWAL